VEAKVRSIEVLGPGCSRCEETYRVVRDVVEQAGLDCEVVKVQSTDRMVELGVLRTPGIAVDGELVFSGRLPREDEVRRVLGLG
jgi:small redox-active disulfide protein 2